MDVEVFNLLAKTEILNMGEDIFIVGLINRLI